MAAAWEERFGKLDRAAEALEKIVAIDNRNYSAYRELARLYQAGRQVRSARRDATATTSWRRPTSRRASSCTSRWAQVYEDELKDVDRAIEAYNDVLSFDGDEQRALDALGRLYEKISEWDRAIDMMAHLVQLTDDARTPGRPVLAHGPHPVRPARRRRRARRRTCSAASRSTRPRADDGGADQAVLGPR